MSIEPSLQGPRRLPNTRSLRTSQLGRWSVQHPAYLVLGACGLLLASTVAFGLGAAGPALQGKTSGTGSGGCPGSNAIKNFLPDDMVGAAFALQGNGSLVTYTLSTTNESPSNGVPGLIEYCVYPAGSNLPGSETAIAIGADGTPFTVHTGKDFFSFGRGNGNPTNVPFDGSQNVLMGNATWTSTAPTAQTILLHINDQSECQALYGSGASSTCFVTPGLAPANCSTPGSAPSALRIQLLAPSNPIPSGGTLTAEYEFAAVNYVPADSGATIYIPSITVHFPLSGSGEVSFYLPPSNTTLSGSGWSAPVGKTQTLGAFTTFATNPHAWLTTSNLAVMASGALPNLTLEFKWGWIANRLGPSTHFWSTPSTTAFGPNYPSIFNVARYVYIVSTSSTSATGGSLFNVVLGGAVSGTSFKTLVENLTGKEFHCQVQTNSGSSTTFEVGVPLTYANSTPLAAGNYLIHVHDAMGAIVRQVSITVT